MALAVKLVCKDQINAGMKWRLFEYSFWTKFRVSYYTYGFTGHVTKAYVSDSNQIMVAYWSVYGDFSPTL